MLVDLIVEPMREDFILWRCLHGGPLNRQNIDVPPTNLGVDWPSARARNIPLLVKLTRTYGACAIMARDGDDVVGTLRFYPMALCSFEDSGAGFCLQQRPPAGPADDLAARGLPSLTAQADKTLFVHCLMITASPGEPERYRRKGLATRLAQELIRWAKGQGWSAIEANAYEELPMLYAISGVAGRRFWERMGFCLARQDTEPAISGDLLETLRRDAVASGLDPQNVANRYRMRLDLTGR
ncbi:MAG: hypothetical protein A2W03_09435 [Candidatus Aminicenantes bacterium RBG_16_63_16]|nr:MAG: hypothetical protein A2W03_09435 [Candidatus Aminicenantes bacterium RBG_16_63_16]